MRVEPRLGGQFVEITHEFLIPSIREAMQTHLSLDADYTRFRATLRTIGRLMEGHTPSEAVGQITSTDFEQLNKYRDHVEWNDWGVELMFRAAARMGTERQHTLVWADRLHQRGGSDRQPPRDFQSRTTTEPRTQGVDASVDGSLPLTTLDLLSEDGSGTVGDIAVRIVREYLASEDFDERRNALKALTAIRSREAAEFLVAKSLDPVAGKIQEYATEELVDLGDGINDEIAESLSRKLSENTNASSVYALLGRLRSSGSPIAVTLPKGWARLRLGLSLFGELYPKGTRKPWSRSVKAAMSGSLLFAVFLSVGVVAMSMAVKAFTPLPLSVSGLLGSSDLFGLATLIAGSGFYAGTVRADYYSSCKPDPFAL